MKLSIVVPTFNRPEAIAACLAALQKQEDVEAEIIVVDDGSPVPVVLPSGGPHPVQVIRQDNAGPATARNRGAAEARGTLLLFTDDDCRPHPGWAAAFRRAAGDVARPTLFGGRTVNAVKGDIFAHASQDMHEALSREAVEPFFPSNNIALPRDAFLDLGGFDTGYRRAAGEDRALCRDWAAAGHGFAEVPDAVLDHHHAMSFRRFWRQQRNYGYGAARFHAKSEGGKLDIRARLGLYRRLVLSPLRDGFSVNGVLRSGLIVLAQVATIQGFAEARRERD